MQPYKCPVCEGRGSLPSNFYTRDAGATSTADIQCRSCKGTGVLWSTSPGHVEPTAAPVPSTPSPPPFMPRRRDGYIMWPGDGVIVD